MISLPKMYFCVTHFRANVDIPLSAVPNVAPLRKHMYICSYNIGNVRAISEPILYGKSFSINYDHIVKSRTKNMAR